MVDQIKNWIQGEETAAKKEAWFDKINPCNGEVLFKVARSQAEDVTRAVESAKQAQVQWALTPAVKRGEILHQIVLGLKNAKEKIAKMVSLETGKSFAAACGEVDGAVQLGLFYASEGQRLYGKTTTSGVANRYSMIVRQPIGVAGLIIAANTPTANVAWKVFPALICGNAAVLKAAEDTPATAWLFGQIAQEAGLPSGVLNIIQGFGHEAGAALVENADVGVISFTGSTAVGKIIHRSVSERLARVSLELGGKNALVVCEDADLENALHWTLLSAFSNAGQRCAASSRIIVFEKIYEEFKSKLLEKIKGLKVGSKDSDDFGPVINEKQLMNMIAAVQAAEVQGAKVLAGGGRLKGPEYDRGFFMAPTLLESAHPEAEISQKELFGPITILYKVKNFEEALTLTNNSSYGLTAAIHTKNLHRAMEFSYKVQTGIVGVNGGTFGSEPHMPFGGYKSSGNGSREPGTEALDVYSELKDIYINIDPKHL